MRRIYFTFVEREAVRLSLLYAKELFADDVWQKEVSYLQEKLDTSFDENTSMYSLLLSKNELSELEMIVQTWFNVKFSGFVGKMYIDEFSAFKPHLLAKLI